MSAARPLYGPGPIAGPNSGGRGPSSPKGRPMKKIAIRKTEIVRLTSAAQPLYSGGCGGGVLA